MLFNSVQFLIFFPLVTLVYFPLPQAAKKPWLLACSYYFYMCWNAGFALLLFFSTFSTWACGFLIDRMRRPAKRRLALAVSLILNLGILFFFKYFDFFSGSLSSLFALFGAAYRPFLLSLTLPVGISFYTFQALGYSIDVYRGTVPHEKNLLDYALFVSFFPQLVAGPIERSANFLPQLHTPKRFDERRVEAGLTQMIYGFFKKVVIADGAAVYVDLVYAAPENFSPQALALATVLFAVELYCDFGGYSDIAIGAAKVLGFQLMRNFDRPYFSSSITEFWRRWHISLSSWLRDYVYIPLGGNRRGRPRKWLNLLLTFLLSGLWHGANWTFILWGGLHGLYLVIEDILRPLGKKLHTALHLERLRLLIRPFRILLTFLLVCFTYIFFRSSSVALAFRFIGRLFSGPVAAFFRGAAWKSALDSVGFFGKTVLRAPGNLLVNTGVGLALCIGLLFLLELLDCGRRPLMEKLSKVWFPLRYLFCLALLGVLLLYGNFTPSGFYYFQF